MDPSAADEASPARPQTLRRRLIRGAAGSFGLAVSSTGVGLLTVLLLARLLGTEGYGTYAYATSLVTVLSVPAALGLDALLVRLFSTYETQNAWGLARGLLRSAYRAVLVSSVILAVLTGLLLWWVLGDREMLLASWIALMSLPFLALSRLRYAALVGLQHVVLAQVPETIVRPGLFIALVAATFLLAENLLSGVSTVALSVISLVSAFGAGTLLLAWKLPPPLRSATPRYETSAWIRAALPLTILAGANLININLPTVVLGAVRGPEEAGLYSLAARTAALIAFPLLAVNAALSPAAARLWAQDERERLQRVVTKSARAILALSLPLALAFILFGDWFLSFFGSGFATAETALAILSVGQLVNAGMGSVGVLLVMTGHQRQAAVGFGIATLVNVVLVSTLVPPLGLVGGATAATISLITSNVLLARAVGRDLGLATTALGRLRFASHP